MTAPIGRTDHQGQADMDVGALKRKKRWKGKGMKGGKGMYEGKGMLQRKRMFSYRGKGKGRECFLCGDPNHWSKECPKGNKGRKSAVAGEENQLGPLGEWNQEWNQDDEWYYDDWTWDESDWNSEWIGSVDDWSGGTLTTGIIGQGTGLEHSDELVRRGLPVGWRTEFRSATKAYTPRAPTMTQMPENDPAGVGYSLVEFHMLDWSTRL